MERSCLTDRRRSLFFGNPTVWMSTYPRLIKGRLFFLCREEPYQ